MRTPALALALVTGVCIALVGRSSAQDVPDIPDIPRVVPLPIMTPMPMLTMDPYIQQPITWPTNDVGPYLPPRTVIQQPRRIYLWPSSDGIRNVAGACNLTAVNDAMSSASSSLDTVIQGSNQNTGSIADQFKHEGYGMDDCYKQHDHPLYLVAGTMSFTTAAFAYELLGDSAPSRTLVHKAFVDLCSLDDYSMPSAMLDVVHQAESVDRTIMKESGFSADAPCDITQLK